MNAKRDFVVGLVFFIGLFVVGFFTIVTKNISFFTGQQGKMILTFNRVDGLEVGHKVQASGMEIGSVSALKLQDDGQVAVEVNLQKPVKLYKGYEIKVKDASALGGKLIDIDVGNGEEVSDDVIDVSGDKVAELKGENKPSLLDNPDIADLVASLKAVAKRLEKGEGTIGLLLTEREIYDNILKASEDLKAITSQLRNSESTIGKLLNDDQLYGRIDKIVQNVEEITGNVRDGKGTLGRLINDDTIHKSLEETLANANKVMKNVNEVVDDVRAGKGTIGKLFTDEGVYDELQLALKDARSALKSINEAVSGMNEGKGTLGTLLKDEKMAQNLRETIESIKVVAKRLEDGEGTIGKLMADDTLYKEIRVLIKSFSDSIEDVREQVPITTFTNILFKAF